MADHITELEDLIKKTYQEKNALHEDCKNKDLHIDGLKDRLVALQEETTRHIIEMREQFELDKKNEIDAALRGVKFDVSSSTLR